MRKYRVGVFAFLIVLLLMPLGHTLMVVLEQIFNNAKYVSAAATGALGMSFLIIGLNKTHQKNIATLLGLLGGVLVWTGWIEFSFVWVAQRLNVQPLIENDEIVTKPEYLIMMSSIGLLAAFSLLFLFTRSRCQFFNWFQRKMKFNKYLKEGADTSKPVAIITFIELIMIIWTFYLVLLFVYDNEFAGDKHWFTYVVAFGSLMWSIYLFLHLIRIKKFDYAIRYAIPTVVIFWNFVEILGRWDLFKEIWIHPKEHWIEALIFLGVLIFFSSLYVFEERKKMKTEILNA